jgi:protein-S-isoprenylcysteine O-methyltransferase Ste14
MAALLAFRAVMEERMLKAELDGYLEYSTRVRYRLLPMVW